MHADGVGAVAGLDVELLQQLGKRQVVGLLVDDQPHRAFVGMGAEIDQRLGESWIAHARHGHQKATFQKIRVGFRFCLHVKMMGPKGRFRNCRSRKKTLLIAIL
jgi:hypothetical protein